MVWGLDDNDDDVVTGLDALDAIQAHCRSLYEWLTRPDFFEANELKELVNEYVCLQETMKQAVAQATILYERKKASDEKIKASKDRIIKDVNELLDALLRNDNVDLSKVTVSVKHE